MLRLLGQPRLQFVSDRMQLPELVRMMCSTNSGQREILLEALPQTRFKTDQATRGLLATDHVVLNHGQVTRTIPELAPPILTTTPTGGRFSSRKT
ncbi:hypothetical protein TNCV_1910351 [Trichonephila clavipes]|nr:hypothetical protein TNCV_1910351 [Trichonephila clavipes]